jgi:hypothetical protein
VADQPKGMPYAEKGQKRKAEAKVGNDNASKAETKPVQSGQDLKDRPKPVGDKSRAVIAE